MQIAKLIITTGGTQSRLAFTFLRSRAAVILVVILVVQEAFCHSKDERALCHFSSSPVRSCLIESFLIPSLRTSCIPLFDMWDVRQSLNICILCSSVIQKRWNEIYHYGLTLTLPISANFNPDFSMNSKCSIVTYFRKATKI